MAVPYKDIQGLELDAIIELFALTQYNPANTSEVFYFANHSGVLWQGRAYTALPVETEGFEYSGRGALPRPRIRVSNVGNIVSGLISQYNDLIGAKLTRKRTLAKYLDGQPLSDPTAEFQDDIWYIEQKTLENDTVVEWELSSSLDLEGLELPRRVIVANVCMWRYRSAECSYAGPPVAKGDDTLTTDPAQDVCGKRISSCRLRFGRNAILPYGAFPSASRF